MPWCQAQELPKQLIIGYQAIPNPETVVKELGWHEKQLGLPIQWVKFDSGRHVNEALAADEVDIGLVGTSPCAAAISNNLAIEVIWIHDVIGDSEALVVKKAAQIARIEDLAGKRVAAPFGSTTHYHLMLALKLAGIPPDTLTLINLEPREMPAVWKQNEVDAAFVWQPTLSTLLDQSGEVLLSSRQLAERGFPTADLCVVRKAFATRYPSVVISYLQNLNRAVTYCRTQPDQAAAAIGRQFGVSPEDAAAQMKGLILLSGEEQISGKYMGDLQFHFGLYTTLKETADFLAGAGQIETSSPWPVFMRAVNPAYILKALE
jgi:taurine transport system substrate-binding protein